MKSSVLTAPDLIRGRFVFSQAWYSLRLQPELNGQSRYNHAIRAINYLLRHCYGTCGRAGWASQCGKIYAI
ncbi:hypothetical protein PANT111_150096 [Pantoea brenneri]|uniref:Transposase n=1 Tax=Pantoea brenneri TaxID=472694 RepID=A0AAX3J3G4_9GAMM|nr:hypothetical protein PANT111_150096 [Pantoea brenneri]